MLTTPKTQTRPDTRSPDGAADHYHLRGAPTGGCRCPRPQQALVRPRMRRPARSPRRRFRTWCASASWGVLASSRPSPRRGCSRSRAITWTGSASAPPAGCGPAPTRGWTSRPPKAPEIRSIGPGVVTEVASDGAFGNKTVVRLDDGTRVWYCHQSEFGVEKGQRVLPATSSGTSARPATSRARTCTSRCTTPRTSPSTPSPGSPSTPCTPEWG